MPETDKAGGRRRIAAGSGRGRGAGLGLLAFGLVAGCSDPGVVTVQADLREAPASESKVLAIIPKGSAIKVGDCSNGWCHVSWNSRDGYILTKSARLLSGARRNVLEAGQPEELDDEDANSAAPDVGRAAPSSPD